MNIMLRIANKETEYLFVAPKEAHCRPHLGLHPQNSLHVLKQNHYPNDHYHALDLCRASRQGDDTAFRSALEGEDVVLVELVTFLANL